MNRILSQLLLGACFAALAESGMAQTSGGGKLHDVADTKAVPTQAADEATPSTHANAKGASSAKAASPSASSKSARHHGHAKTTSHKKSKPTSHVAKSTKPAGKSSTSSGEASVAPEENAYRQALRGCATQQNQALRDSCLDDAIGKFQRNT